MEERENKGLEERRRKWKKGKAKDPRRSHERAFKNPRDQLGIRNLLLQAFPTCWQGHHGCVSKSDRTTARVHCPVFTSHQLRQKTRV